MALPGTLKDLMVFHNGTAYIGEVKKLTPPKLVRKLEEYRGAGMDSGLKIDVGGEPMEAEHTYGGEMRDIMRDFGITQVAGVLLRFVGTFQRDDTGEVDKIEIVMRGRHEEIDRGEWEQGNLSELKVKTALAYYKEERNGVIETEIDPLNFILTVGGVDRLAERRAALGI